MTDNITSQNLTFPPESPRIITHHNTNAMLHRIILLILCLIGYGSYKNQPFTHYNITLGKAGKYLCDPNTRSLLKCCSFANVRHSLMQWERSVNLNPKIERETIRLVCLNHYEMCCGKRDSLIDSTPTTCGVFRGVDSGVNYACFSRVCFTH
jgi:hypothetical protein